ncbi:MAG: TDT family transporter [Rhodococcus sp.]|nr:TDT family transporter [Rhodococcus sp. (in: high G+C Gram-positive bacteria)]
MTPNWFAAVMGTGIISVVAAALPGDVTGARAISIAFAVLSALLLIALTTALTITWIRDRERAVADARSPQMFPFYGAVSMALLTVGAAVHHLAPTSVTVVLWSVGTALGLVTYVVMMVRLRGGYPTEPTLAWLLPIVPPMVSATGAAALIEHLPAGATRVAVLAAGYGFFVLALMGAFPPMVLVARHFLRTGLPEVAATPTLWIPLGVVGQSVAAANLLGGASGSAVLRGFGVAYGCTVGAVGTVALVATVAVTVRAFADGLVFNPGWWSFTFPLGACALGANSLGVSTDATALRYVALGILCALIVIWSAVARGSLCVLLATRARRSRLSAKP